MPTTVDAALAQLASELSTSKFETQIAASHRASVEECLKNNFGITGFFLSGSFGNGTNVSGYSDIDRFAIFPAATLKPNSNLSLGIIARALRKRFPLTGVKVDAPGIRMPFGLGGIELNEIIPVYEVQSPRDDIRMFGMPDGNGGWMLASPEAHNAYVSYHDNRLGGKLKPLIRLIKAWKFYKQIPIKSFYLEMVATQYAKHEEAIVYSIDFEKILALISNNALADIPDPFGVMEDIKACNSPGQRLICLGRLNQASLAVKRANLIANKINDKAAFGVWKAIFNNHFPVFG